MTIKKNKRKVVIKWLLISVIFLGIAFLVTAYASGTKVVDDEISLQWVSHTEYWKNDSAATIIRLADYRGNPIAVNECRVTILNPDKTVFVDNQLMTESNIAGNWYRTDSLVDAPLGTFEQEVTCTRGNQTIKSSQSFHLNPALEQINTLTGMTDSLNLELSDVNLSITGLVEETGQEISANVTNLNTSLNNILNDVNNSMVAQFENTNSNLNTALSNVEVSVNGTVTSTGTAIQSQITDLNTSLSQLINNLVIGDLTVQLDGLLESLTDQIVSVKEDTNWLVTHAMNDSDMDEIEARFNSIDNNLQLLEQFCSTQDTNSSALCQEIYNIKSAIAVMDSEQQTKLDEINTTTVNTWQLLSGDVTTSINSLLSDIGIIKEQTTDINSTVHEILDSQQSEIQVRIIS